jgi:hypothetical protein
MAQAENLPSEFAPVRCCGAFNNTSILLTADRSAAAPGTRTHDIEVFPRWGGNGYIAIRPENCIPVTAANWIPDPKGTYTRTSGVNSFTLTSITDAATITLVLTVTAGDNSISLTGVAGNTVTVDLATTAGVSITTWKDLADFLNAQPTVAAIVTAAASGANVDDGSLLFTAGSYVAAPLTAKTKTMAVEIQDEEGNVISPAITLTLTGSDEDGVATLAGAAFSTSPSNASLIDATGRIIVEGLIDIAVAAQPTLTKIILHMTDLTTPITGRQFDQVGWSWHAA